MEQTKKKKKESGNIPSSPHLRKGKFPVFIDYVLMTIGAAVTAAGIYFFTFPNNFTMGGVSGLSVVLGHLFRIEWLTPGTFVLAINILLIILGFLILGRGFGIRTVYCSLVMSGLTYLFERICPMPVPFTDQPLLELIFAVFLPAVGSAFLFYLGASSGGTDIVAMILKKFFRINISRALFFTDMAIVIMGGLVFDATIFLFSIVGLFAKVFLVDIVLESINTSKYCTVITTPACEEQLCHFITQELHKTATVSEAYMGAYGKDKKVVILVALTRGQAARLRRFSDSLPEKTFTIITSTNEILGLGFREPM